ncbi:MAG: calcium-binding protein, partial [Solirubrobacterales bacterium]
GSVAVTLRVFAGNTNVVTPVGESATVTVTPVTPPPFKTRIPVAGGERLGYSFQTDNSSNCVSTSTAAAGDVAVAAVSGPLGQAEPSGSPQTNTLMNVSATLEPDADRDGFGDETQDGCPSSAQTAGACATPPSLSVCAGRKATIVGTEGGDRLRGTFGADVIAAGGGADIVIGRGGRDVICGGSGMDELKGGTGRDKLIGDEDKDKLVGGGGKDSCNGGAARDRTRSCERGPNH